MINKEIPVYPCSLYKHAFTEDKSSDNTIDGEKSLTPPKIKENGVLESLISSSLLKEIMKEKECRLEQILRKDEMKVQTDFECEKEHTLINKPGRTVTPSKRDKMQTKQK